MKLSTGTNSGVKEKILSIRLSPDGLSFWTTGLAGAPAEAHSNYFLDYGAVSEEKYITFSKELGPEESVRRALVRADEASRGGVPGAFRPVRLMPDTCKTVLVPAELFDPEQAADYLKINNITVGAAETVEVSHITIDTPSPVAVMVYSATALRIAREVFDARLGITSPFEAAAAYTPAKLRRKDADKCFASLYLTGTNVYITVWRIGVVLEYCEVLPYSTTADILYYMHEVGARFGLHKNPIYIRGTGAKDTARMLKKSFKKCKCE